MKRRGESHPSLFRFPFSRYLEKDTFILIPPTLTNKLRMHPVLKAIYLVSQQVGIPIYLVGGAVRDLLMGILPEKDFDFVTADHLVIVTRLFSKIFSGNLVKLSSNPPNYRVIFYRNNNRIEVDFSSFRGDDLYQDLANRDFTVNAIALRANGLFQGEKPMIYDPLGGEDDIQKRVLRTSSPHSFDQDPLRILRAVRIAKERNLRIEPNTREEMCRQKDLLCSIAAERIRKEFFKIISFSDARDSLKLLGELGLLSLLLPEIETFKGRGDLALWEHSLETMGWCERALDHLGEIFPEFQKKLQHHFEEEIEADVDRRGLLKLAGFLLTFEKPFLGQEGIEMSGKIARRFKLGKQASRILKKMVEYQNRVSHLFKMENPNFRTYFRFFRDSGPEGLGVLMLSWAEYISRAPEKFESTDDLRFRNFVNSLITYYFTKYLLTSPKPLLSGQDIIKEFGLKEGRIIGDLLNHVASAEAEGLLSCRDEAFAYVEELLEKAIINE